MAKQPIDRLLKWVGLSAQGDLGPLTTYVNHNGKLVVFPRAPPLNPPSQQQETIRAFFQTTATAWHALTESKRQNWLAAARKAKLRIGGYNLFLWYLWSADRATIETISEQTGVEIP